MLVIHAAHHRSFSSWLGSADQNSSVFPPRSMIPERRGAQQWLSLPARFTCQELAIASSAAIAYNGIRNIRHLSILRLTEDERTQPMSRNEFAHILSSIGTLSPGQMRQLLHALESKMAAAAGKRPAEANGKRPVVEDTAFDVASRAGLIGCLKGSPALPDRPEHQS